MCSHFNPFAIPGNRLPRKKCRCACLQKRLSPGSFPPLRRRAEAVGDGTRSICPLATSKSEVVRLFRFPRPMVSPEAKRPKFSGKDSLPLPPPAGGFRLRDVPDPVEHPTSWLAIYGRLAKTWGVENVFMYSRAQVGQFSWSGSTFSEKNRR